MRRKDFMEKYADVLQGIIDSGIDVNDAAGVQAPDGDTAMAILSEMVQKDQPNLHAGIPEGTDWEALKADYATIDRI